MSPATSPLHDTLEAFRSRVNDNPRAIRLIHAWDRDIAIDTFDGHASAVLHVREGRVRNVSAGPCEIAQRVEIRAEESVLINVFNGATNPSIAFIDGELEVFGSDDDRLKLDAITLVVWGA